MNPGRPPPPGAMQQGVSAGPNTNVAQGAGNGGAASQADLTEWQRDEHARFMQALEIYGSRRTGDEWKLITNFVGSRTIEEVRLHGRQYLQRLVQQLPPSPEAAAANRFLSSAGSQNDPNRQNYQVPRGVELQKPRGGKGKRPATQPGLPLGGSSALSAAALECAQSMSVQAPIQFHNQSLQPLPPQHQAGTADPRRNGRRSKPWTFQEDKAFETVLADWAGSKPYSWAKIAAALPGKTVKDVRSRYDEMVGEITCIESGEIPVPDSSALNSVPSGPAAGRPTSMLSRRAVPPPPIEVPPRSVGKDGAVGVFPPGSSTRSQRGSASGITMLSPTFLDLLANEAESEEKSPLPALPMPFPGLMNLPSPLFSPTLLPSGSPGFFSPGNKKSAARGQQDKKFSSLEGSSVAKMEDIEAGPRASAGKSDDPQRSTTPRIWNDFLADDFKFDDPLGSTPRHSSRKTPRSKVGEGSPTTKTSKKKPGQEDVEMTDASAA
ncbi:transcription factor DIVARICATA-like [Phytophthora cinnamomi]|uniref:transcription factor DIVARICATA-like n=1 Tax=Phytophthora cinnamomi TaxID=4785 RepID=UPI0035594DD7|nr:transcription factor DIVARICATA-like [Phytophthora cinnamomi]